MERGSGWETVGERLTGRGRERERERERERMREKWHWTAYISGVF